MFGIYSSPNSSKYTIIRSGGSDDGCYKFTPYPITSILPTSDKNGPNPSPPLLSSPHPSGNNNNPNNNCYIIVYNAHEACALHLSSDLNKVTSVTPLFTQVREGRAGGANEDRRREATTDCSSRTSSHN